MKLQSQLNQLESKPHKPVKVKTEKAKRKGFGKKKSNPYKMDVFDLDKVIEMSKGNLNMLKAKKSFKQKLAIKKENRAPQFGDEKEYSYELNAEILETTMKVCRFNGWFTKEDWVRHKIPMNRLINTYWKSTVEYGDIKKYYLKNFFEERRREQIGVRNDE